VNAFYPINTITMFNASGHDNVSLILILRLFLTDNITHTNCNVTFWLFSRYTVMQ